MNRWEHQRLNQGGAHVDGLWETYNKIRSIRIHNKRSIEVLYPVGIDGLPSTEFLDLPQPVRNWEHGNSMKGKADHPAQSKRPIKREA